MDVQWTGSWAGDSGPRGRNHTGRSEKLSPAGDNHSLARSSGTQRYGWRSRNHPEAGDARGTFVYEYEANPPGSYIYHSHGHYQLDQGLYGALIIEPSHPGAAYDREYTLLSEDWVMRDGGGVANTRRRPPMGSVKFTKLSPLSDSRPKPSHSSQETLLLI